MNKKTADVIVKVIGILGYIGAAFAVLGGLILIFAGPLFAGYFNTMMGPLSSVAGGALVFAGIFAIIFGALAFWISYALMQHKNWARIVLIVLSALGVLGALFSLPASVVNLLIDGAILYFLAFDKVVMSLFKK